MIIKKQKYQEVCSVKYAYSQHIIPRYGPAITNYEVFNRSYFKIVTIGRWYKEEITPTTIKECLLLIFSDE